MLRSNLFIDSNCEMANHPFKYDNEPIVQSIKNLTNINPTSKNKEKFSEIKRTRTQLSNNDNNNNTKNSVLDNINLKIL